MTVDLIADVMSRATTRPALLGRLPGLLETMSEEHCWSRSTAIANDAFGASSSAAFELVEPHRIELHAERGDVDWVHGVFPVAPDSQAAYVLASDRVVTSAALDVDRRFVAAPMLIRAGIRSAMSCRFGLPAGGAGIVGVYSVVPDAYDCSDEATFEQLVEIVGIAVRQSRLRTTLVHDASHDPLTGLVNRTALLDHLGAMIESDDDVTALLIDLDGFKAVNDDHGHRVGDSVLAQVARRLERSVGIADVCGRLGGDEFLVLTTCRSESDLARLSNRMISSIEEIIVAEDRTIQISASIGAARTAGRHDPSSVIDAADQLMYRAKSAGRGSFRIEDSPVALVDTGDSVRVTTVGSDLSLVEEAIAGLRVLFQPIVHASSRNIVAVEALTRGPVGHPLEFPDVLFPTATTYGRLGALELEAKRVAFASDLPPHLTLFVNIEPSAFTDPALLAALTDLWHESGGTRQVVAELTERSVLATPGRLLGAVDACRSIGWRIALDDVGARSESLAALRCVRPDVVKLDMGVIRETNRAHTAHIAVTIAGYSGQNEVTIIAEGVETARHAQVAEMLGADHLQGYLLGRPMTAAEISTMVDADLLHAGHRRSAQRRSVQRRADQRRTVARRAVDWSPTTSNRIATKLDLIYLSRHIESMGLTSDSMLLASLQRVEFLSERTRRQYRALARRCGLVGLVGTDLSASTHGAADGFRLADMAHDDPLAGAWRVVVISPTISLALLAEELTTGRHDDGADIERLFRYRLTSNPAEVEAAAIELLRYF